MGKNKRKQTDRDVIEQIASIKKQLKAIKHLTDDADNCSSVICKEARAGAKRLLMTLKVAKKDLEC